ncbi:MAG: putative toxin-antitoxin system toxin component, PIN family [bacterium]
MRHVVIDTNVLVSACLRVGLPLRVLEVLLTDPEWRPVVTRLLAAEYLEVLRRPHIQVGITRQPTILDRLLDVADLVDPVATSVISRDTKDQMVLEAAAGGMADFLITGDKDILACAADTPFRIVSVRDFAILALDLTP